MDLTLVITGEYTMGTEACGEKEREQKGAHPEGGSRGPGKRKEADRMKKK